MKKVIARPSCTTQSTITLKTAFYVLFFYIGRRERRFLWSFMVLLIKKPHKMR